MSADEAARNRNEMTNAMLTATETLAPIFDAADGMRVDMERRGWSPVAAEKVALQWLEKMLAMAMTP